MNRLVAGAAALNQTPLDWSGNTSRITTAIAKARDLGIQWLCFPELALTGYGCEDMFLAPEVETQAVQSLLSLAPQCHGMVVALGLPLRHEGTLYNSVAVIIDGHIAGFVAKQKLAGSGLHYEPRWFQAWPKGRVGHLDLEGRDIPFGDLVFEIGGLRLGLAIGEDAQTCPPDETDTSQEQIDLLFNPSATAFVLGQGAVHEQSILKRSQSSACGYLYANLLGNEAGRILYDGGTLVAEAGTLLARGPRFSFQDNLLTAACFDLDSLRDRRSQRSSSVNPQRGDGATTIRCEYTFAAQASLSAELSQVHRPIERKEEELARVIALGLFDYLRKTYSGGFVVSLSGGADSGAAVVLIKLMVDLGIGELGEALFRKKLGHLRLDERPLMAQLLSCVYQATRNSSETTRHAAATLATAIGADYQEWDVDALVEGYRAVVEQGIGRTLSWETDDLALQNVQARVRAPGAWMLANIRNALLLTTSNRSEGAVGYTTMDGDTSGGLSPLGGIDKAFLRQWLSWLESEGAPPDIRPIPELHVINAQDPTAELRPKEYRQNDESDLMPYPILNEIEALAIRDKNLPVKVWSLLCTAHPEIDRETLRTWVSKFFRLWCRNQWKRERYAPAFHLDDRNLDPKTWCRFPILSSGFHDELAELENAP